MWFAYANCLASIQPPFAVAEISRLVEANFSAVYLTLQLSLVFDWRNWMTSATTAGFVYRSGFYYEWTTSRSSLARKLTNYKLLSDSSIASRQLTHGTAFVAILARSFDHVSTQRRNKCGWKHGFAYFKSTGHSPHSIGEMDIGCAVQFSDKLV